jgi:hypothetical protein
VQAALLRVVLERAVGDLTLPDEVAVVAAANPPEQAADGWDLSAPLANRLCHLTWHTDPRAVADGLAGGWAAPVVPVLPDGWQAEELLSRGLVAAFLHVRPALALPDPEQVLADPASFRLPERGDRAYAALAAIAAAVAGNPTEERWTAGWRVLGRFAGAAPDVAAVAARVLARCRPDGAALPAEINLFAPVLRDAGLLQPQTP